MRARTTFVVLFALAALAGIVQAKPVSADYILWVTSPEGLHLRTEPNTDSDETIIDLIPEGEAVDILDDSADWFYVNYDGDEGWVYSAWLGDESSVGGYDYNSDGYCVFVWGDWACASDYLTSVIYEASAYYGADGDFMFEVAACESGFNPDDIGPYDERGIFQFRPGFFMNADGIDLAFATSEEQAYFAAMLFAQGHAYDYWTCAVIMG